MKFRQKLLFFGLAVATLTALAVFLAGGMLIRRSVSDRVKERLESEVYVLADWLAGDPTLLPDPGSISVGEPEAALGQPGAPNEQSSGRSSESSGVDSKPGSATATPNGVPTPDQIARSGLPAPFAAADAFADKAGSSLGLRVTVVDAAGRVLGDSSLDGPDLLKEENHAGRPEIVTAKRNGYGTSIRTSATVHDELFYVARRVQRKGLVVGYVRLAVPVSEIQRVTGGYSATLALISFLILMAVSAAGYAAARRFSRPIEEMSIRADAIAAGRRDLEVEYGSDDEIGSLGAAFNRMTRALSEQIRALSSEKKLRDTILGGMKEGILVLDRDRRVLLCNDSLKAILGLRGQNTAGRPLIEIARDRRVVERFEAALLRGEESREIVHAGGTAERSFEIHVAPLTDPAGLQIGAIGLFVDITRLTALESVRRDFVADVSHELRTPLTSIKAFVETLLAGGLEDASNNRRFLEIVKKHSDRMEAILDDLTDLSLIETGAISLDFEKLDMASLAQDLVDSLRPKAEGYRVNLETTIAPGTFLQADRRRLEQILLNLLDNAIKFNRSGGRVSLHGAVRSNGTTPHVGSQSRPEEDLGVVRIEVEDTGVGIPAEALDKVFHRFYRVDRARSREMGGTGLGLSIVKHLVHLHGGSVRIESEVGRGSRFILEFPAELHEE